MSNIPSFSDICGTVVESLAETIRNREAIIIQLREDNARLERSVESWKNEAEAAGEDEKKVWQLTAEVARLKGELVLFNAELGRVRNELVVSQNLHKSCDQQCKTLLRERDDARRLYCEFVANVEESGSAEQIASQYGWDCLPPSDSDPVTGVQYGDLT